MTSLARNLAPVLLLSALLAGCLGAAPPVPRDHYYRLVVPGPAEPPAEPSARPLLPGVLTVETMQAEGLLHERPLLYSENGRPHEVQQHDYHYWTDAPPNMLQDQLVAYLRRSGIAQSVVTPDIRVRADYRLTIKVKRLERLIGGGPPGVFVELEFALVRLADGRLIVADSYGVADQAADGSVKAAIVAMNRATAQLFARFLAGTAAIARATAERR